GEPESKVKSLIQDLQRQRQELERLQRQVALSSVDTLQQRAGAVDGVKVLAVQVEAPNQPALRELGDALRARLGPSVVVLAAVNDGRPVILAMVAKGVAVDAGSLVRSVATTIVGSGGGRPDFS